MAEVFLGLARAPHGLGKLVVIKRLRAAAAADDQVACMFLDEARLSARLMHPNVVTTYEAYEEDNQLFMVMEYLEGQSLSVVRKAAFSTGQPIPAMVWVRVVADALRGLHYAHELCDYDGSSLGVIHRDVSPQNIFVTYEGTTKLLDFGIAKALCNSSHTQTGILKGKASYMAPEQILGSLVDRRADVFSMGVVLWELLTQRRLYEGEPGACLHKVISAKAPLPSEFTPGIPPELDAIVLRALEKRADDRYQTASEMRLALESLPRTDAAPIEEEAVARMMAQLFDDKRREQQRRITQHMSDVTYELRSSSSGIPVLSDSVPRISVSTANVVSIGQASQSRLLVRRPQNPFVAWALASAAAMIVFGIALGSVRGRPLRPPRAEHLVSPARPLAEAPPQRVRIAITTTPAGAEVILDGAAIGSTPITTIHGRDADEHRLVVTAAGYSPEIRMIRFERDASLSFDLSPHTRPPGTAPRPVQAEDRPTKLRGGAAPARAAGTGDVAPGTALLTAPRAAPIVPGEPAFNPWN